MAWLEENPIQRLLTDIEPPGPVSVMPSGAEGAPMAMNPMPPVAPSEGLLPPGTAGTSGMAPYNISDQSVKSFVESPFMQQARGAQNIGNVPMGEFLRLLMNQAPATPAIPPAPTGGGLIPAQNAVPTPQVPGMSREQLETAGPQGILPWDFYAKNPDFAGGVMKVGQTSRWDMARKLGNVGFPIPQMSREEMIAALTPQPGQPGLANAGTMDDDQLRAALDRKGINYFKMSDADMQKQLHTIGGDLAGKLYSLVEPKRDTSLQTQTSGLINQWTEKISDALARGDTAAAYSYGKSLKDIISQLPPLMTAQTGASKAPSEIAANTANANRAQIVPNVTSGPGGQQSTLLVPSGGAPRTIATGVSPSAEHGANIGSMITNIYTHVITEIAKVKADPLRSEEQKNKDIASIEDQGRNAMTGIQSMMNKPGGAPGGTPASKMTLAEYYSRLRAKGIPEYQISREAPIAFQQGKISR